MKWSLVAALSLASFSPLTSALAESSNFNFPSATTVAAKAMAIGLKALYGASADKTTSVKIALASADLKISNLRIFAADKNVDDGYRFKVLDSEIAAANTAYEANTGSLVKFGLRPFFESKMGKISQAVQNRNKADIANEMADLSLFVKTTRSSFEKSLF